MPACRLLPLVLLLAFPFAASAQSATQIVTEAYEDVLGRKPDAGGLSTFRSRVIDDNWTAEDVRKALRDSDEYADRLITEAFQDLLGRKPDKGALETYRPRIRKDKWTEKRLRDEIRNSQEFKNRSR
jgi:hypothetical protein